MATLQRSTAFRRQGSSGVVWEDKCFLKEDKVDYKELRPCQSARVVGVTDPGNSFPSQLFNCPHESIFESFWEASRHP
jgi:hypothetical protein